MSVRTLEHAGTVHHIRPPSGIDHACSPTTSNINEHLIREEANDIIVTVILLAKPTKKPVLITIQTAGNVFLILCAGLFGHSVATKNHFHCCYYLLITH